MTMRLDKFLSKACNVSRKDAKNALREGRVLVNGEPIKDGAFGVNASDVVQYGDERLQVSTQKRYLLLYKPEGFECSLKAKRYPIVTELIAVPDVASLRIAGRLDVDTTGALLLSDDGAWLHRVSSPKRHKAKVYSVVLDRPMNPSEQKAAIQEAQKGLWLAGEKQKTRPTVLEFSAPTRATLTLTEGKHHQVKRTFAHFGNEVVSLHRQSVAGIGLDGLQKGECRFLRPEEVALF